MPISRSLPRIAFASSFLVVLSSGLLGCSGALTPTAVAPAAIPVTGNWQVASTAPAAGRLPALSGELTGSTAHMTGIFHSDSASACVPPSTAFDLAGSADSKNAVTLTAANFAGGTLTLTGTLAGDGKSLSGASYNVVGGACAFPAAAAASAQVYSSISGAYTGSFSDPSGQVISISANLTQTPQSDPNGNFQLSGTGTFPNNPCFSSPVSISNSQVSGGSFDLTYTDNTTQNTVEALGTFSTDGQTLNVTQWNLTGTCGPDSGTGSLAK